MKQDQQLAVETVSQLQVVPDGGILKSLVMKPSLDISDAIKTLMTSLLEF
jgi:hypothetical protein